MSLLKGGGCCRRTVTIDTATGKASKNAKGDESSDMSDRDQFYARGDFIRNPDSWSDPGNPPRGGQTSGGLRQRDAIFCGDNFFTFVG